MNNPINNWQLILLLCFSLGLAPFLPEPHIVGKIRWIAGGANGMALLDWGDTLFHGLPWLLLFRLIGLKIFKTLSKSKTKPLILVFVLLSTTTQAQEGTHNWLKKLEKYNLKPSVGIQLWGSYTMNEEVFNESIGKYEAVDDRLNFQIRRTRLGLKGQPYENLQFNITASLDLVGRDLLAGTEAGSNNGSSPQFRLWNAYIQARLIPNSEKLNVVAGYLPPQIGRESITAALRSTSMEKSWSQNYLRRHLTGIGPGRAMGINVGGLFLSKNNKFNWGYDLGVFNPVFHSYAGNSIGKKYSPLFVARLATYIGDPESRKYTISHKVNYFGKRNGLTLAFAGASQGKTDLFLANTALGMDFLLNWGNLNFDGEWTHLMRKGEGGELTSIRQFAISSNTGYMRLGYNFELKNGYILEPNAMIVQYNGEMEGIAQADASSMNTPSGKEQILDFGFNLFFNPDVKFSVHYTHRQGDSGDMDYSAKINNYFYQSGVGAIHRGNWLGIGSVFIF